MSVKLANLKPLILFSYLVTCYNFSTALILKNKINFLLVFLGVLACILFSLFLPGVYALEEIKLTDRTDYSLKHIGIEFSSSCVTLQKLNDSDVCSNSDFVKSMFPPIKLKPAYQVMFDNTEKTDQLTYQKNDIMQNHRSSCIIKNYCNVFDIKPGTKIIYWYDIDSKARGYLIQLLQLTPICFIRILMLKTR